MSEEMKQKAIEFLQNGYTLWLDADSDALPNAMADFAAQVWEQRETRRFPLEGGPSIPWSIIEPHERQAKLNHDQSLARLAERGGLSTAEFWFVMNDLPYDPSLSDANRKGKILAEHLISWQQRAEAAVLALQNIKEELRVSEFNLTATEIGYNAVKAALQAKERELAQQREKRMDVLLDENCIATIKRLTPEGGEEISFGGIMGGIRLKWTGSFADSVAQARQQAIAECLEIAKRNDKGHVSEGWYIYSAIEELRSLTPALTPADDWQAKPCENCGSFHKSRQCLYAPPAPNKETK